MEKKTMGSFIAALRRANGMTQKELAERLNVSDKSVSRWECDEGYPDLSLIPVIAEIFSVTSDELLKGERKTEERSDAQFSEKGKKEKERVKAEAKRRFRSSSIISMGLSLLALVVAAAINLGLVRAYIAFFSSLSILLLSVVLETIFLSSYISRNKDEDNGGTVDFGVLRTGEVSFSIVAAVLGFLLPLVVLVSDANFGLTGGSWILYGSLFSAAFLALSLIAIHIINGTLVKKDKVYLTPEKKERYCRLHRLKSISILSFAVILAITILLHVALTEIWGPRSVMKGTRFTDYESFIAFIEKDEKDPRNYRDGEVVLSEVTYYDMDGNVVTKDKAFTRHITDINGDVVLTYVQRNHTVLSVSYSPSSGSVLPITVYTYDDYEEAIKVIARRNVIFAFIYAFEVVITILIYFFFRKEIKA